MRWRNYLNLNRDKGSRTDKVQQWTRWFECCSRRSVKDLMPPSEKKASGSGLNDQKNWRFRCDRCRAPLRLRTRARVEMTWLRRSGRPLWFLVDLLDTLLSCYTWSHPKFHLRECFELVRDRRSKSLNVRCSVNLYRKVEFIMHKRN